METLILFQNQEDLLQQVLEGCCGSLGGVLLVVVDKVEGNAGGLLLGKKDLQFLLELLEGVGSDLKFLLVEVLDFVGEGHFYMNAFPLPLNGELDVVGEGKNKIVGDGFVGDLLGEANDLLRDAEDLVWHFGNHGHKLGIHIVIGAVQPIQVYLAGKLSETDSLAVGNHLHAAAV